MQDYQLEPQIMKLKQSNNAPIIIEINKTGIIE